MLLFIAMKKAMDVSSFKIKVRRLILDVLSSEWTSN